MASVLTLVLFSLFSYGYCANIFNPRGFPRQPRQDENLFELNALTPRQGSLMQQLLALLQKPEPVDNTQIPAEDPNIRVVRPAGGDVLPGGAAIAGLNLGAGAAGIVGLLPEPLTAPKVPEVIVAAVQQESMNKQAVDTTMAPPPPPTGPAGGSPPPTPMGGVNPLGGNPPPMNGTMPPPPPMNSTMAPTPAGNTTTAASVASTMTASVAPTTSAYAVTTARPTGPVATTTMMNSYGASYASYGGTSGMSYGSSGTSYGSTGSTGTSGTSGSSGSTNSLGVPYGYYTQVQYFPYAQNASSQLTHPIVFSPYLPIPSYINKYFGLNLPLTMGRR